MTDAGLKGKTVLITGASSGLGLHFSRVLHREGANIILTARRKDRLDRIAESLDGAQTFELDLCNSKSIDHVFEQISSIDVLINNAGITETKPALEISEHDWDRILDTNLKGAWLASQRAAALMKTAGKSGAIVNIASIVGQRVARNLLSYAVSKSALIHLTKALALEWARDQIRVNALAPGYIETDLNREFLQSAAGKTMIKRIPMQRTGQLEDLDQPLLLLCGEGGKFMTGSVLVVDGGHLVNSL